MSPRDKPTKTRKGRKPDSTDEAVTPPHPAAKAAAGYPILSLRHCVSGFGVDDLTDKQRSEFLLKWAKRSNLTWTDLRTHSKHGLGSEKIPLRKIKPACPEILQDAEDVLVFRHEGNLPFAGVRADDVFYVVWIESSYNDLYEHDGGKNFR